MNNNYLLLLKRLVGLFVVMVVLTLQAAAQRPSVLTFPDIPCDSTAWDSLVIVNRTIVPEELVEIRIRDSVNYLIGPGFTLPRTILPGDSVSIPLSFTPSRRGSIVDSLFAVINTAAGPDTVMVRLAGRGIGPSLQVAPIVLNFPKTNVTTISTLGMMLHNTGELPYELTAARLNIPPPFRLLNPLPLTILPGDSVELLIVFEPLENGVYSVAVDLAVGCGVRLQIGLNGATELIGTGAVLRLSKVGFNPVNNEQTPCDVERCTEVTLSNAGNAPLVIEDIQWENGGQGYVIRSNPPTPFLVEPNGQRTIEVCLVSNTRGTFRDTMIITSNTRSSIAFGMVIDGSGSMTGRMQCGTVSSSRMAQAIIQANNFISRTLLHIPSIGIQDQLVINSYSSRNDGVLLRINFLFPLTYITDVTRGVAQAAVTGIAPEGGTPTGAAVKRMVDALAMSPLRNRVIVLLTDGEADVPDQRNHPLASVIKHANDNDIRIFTIGVGLQGNGQNYLRRLAQETGGTSFDATDNDCEALQGAFEAITDIVSRGAKHYEPFGIKVIAPSLVATRSVDFDSLYVKGTRCTTLTVANIGEGNAIVDSIYFHNLAGGPTTEFYLPPGITLPISIPEGETIELPVCFTAEKIRMRGGKVYFRYNNCGQGPTSSQFSGAAYAEANLRIVDQRIGLPDDIVTLPVYADSSLAEYDVDKITYELRWNRTMLDLRTVRPGPAAGTATVALDGPVTYTGGDAVARLVVSGGRAAGAGELAQFEFMVLRGDALSSKIELKEGLFADDNPRTILVNGGIVGFDSTCFRDAKPVSAGGASKMTVGDAGPTPATGNRSTIPLSADGAVMLTMELYGVDGDLIRQPVSYDLPTGSGEIRIDLADLASGSYYAILKSSTGETFLRKILVAR